MYVKGVKTRVNEIEKTMGVKEEDLEYPTLPSGEKISLNYEKTVSKIV